MVEKAILDGEEKVESNSIDGFVEKILPIDSLTSEQISDIIDIANDFEINDRGYLEVRYPPEGKNYVKVNQDILEDLRYINPKVLKFRAKGFNKDLLLEEVAHISNGFHRHY